VSGELSEKLVVAQYIQRAVQGSRGSVITFSPSTVIKMWGKWFGYSNPPEHLTRKVSALLNKLANCGLLHRYRLYRYQLKRGDVLWSLAESGRLTYFMEAFKCYIGAGGPALPESAAQVGVWLPRHTSGAKR